MHAVRRSIIAWMVLPLFGLAFACAVAPSSALAAASITVTPDTDLAATHQVEVSGTGFDPDTFAPFAHIDQCTDAAVSGIINTCTSLTSGGVQVAADGTFGPVAVTVTRSFIGRDGQTYDCFPDLCMIRVFETFDATAHANITFGRSATTTSLDDVTTPVELSFDATGTVSPNHAGDPVFAKLFADSGSGWTRIDRDRPTLDETSNFIATFSTGLIPSDAVDCKVVARFKGDTDHLPSKDRERFAC